MSGGTGASAAASRLPEGMSFWHPATLLATWFGTGLLPRMPGTWGSLAALPLAWVAADRFGPYGVLATGFLLLAAGLWASGRFLRRAGDRDPRPVVIDEVAGQTLACAPAGLDPVAFALAFALFRAFDILKPWPIGAIERRLGGAAGVMADDLAAALCTVLMIAMYFFVLEQVHVFL